MSGNREPMLDLFIYETMQQIEKLEQSVLDSEQASDMQISINEIFRIMHTIKGNSAMMLFNNISELAHSMEDMFDHLRETKCWMKHGFDYTAITDLVLTGIDFIKNEIAKIDNNQSSDGDSSALIAQIRQHLAGMKGGESSAKSKGKENEKKKKMKYYISSQPKTDKNGNNEYQAIVFFEEGCEMEDIRAFTLIHSIKEVCQNIRYYPEDILENNDSKDIIIKNGFKIIFTSDLNYEEAKNYLMKTPFLKHMEFERVKIEKKATKQIVLDDDEIKSSNDEKTEIKDTGSSLRKTASDEAEEAGKPVLKSGNTENSQSDASIALSKIQNEINESRDNKAATAAASQNTGTGMISVSVSKLDKLMDLVGELVISEAMVTRNPDLLGLNLENFQKSARQLRKITNELQDVAMSIRMVSLAPTFQKMNRLIRDMSKKVGKQVQLELVGQDTEVDKNIIENIGDPLMHLIRNAVDHGIETTEEREKTGKPAQGTITLEAKNIGSDVWIEVRDDGKGLDKDRILRKALENGLTNKKEEELTDREIFSFIFLPGFSTKEKVTEFSGRGVGMDVVQKNIEKVRGTIYVDSVQGKGTTISIKIPLTLSIIDGMTIKVGESMYTIPITSIRESLRISGEQVIEDLEGREMIMLRGESFPIIRLHKLYKVETKSVELKDGIIIVVESDTKTICLFADELIGEQQVVVKTLPNYIKKVKGVAGCTILGDGGISLILNIQDLLTD
ncbi:MAG: chemotaxis protein CheW [Bacillota bacterium]